MKYKDIDVKQARQCCKEHRRKNSKGKIYSDCETCPLRRTRTDKEGKKHTLFCWFVLNQVSKEMDYELKELEKEEIQYQKEWNEYIKNLQTEE